MENKDVRLMNYVRIVNFINNERYKPKRISIDRLATVIEISYQMNKDSYTLEEFLYKQVRNNISEYDRIYLMDYWEPLHKTTTFGLSLCIISLLMSLLTGQYSIVNDIVLYSGLGISTFCFIGLKVCERY